MVGLALHTIHVALQHLPEQEIPMSGPVQISPSEAREHVNAGSALLVCAYDSDEKFNNNRLAGAIAMSTFTAKVTGLASDQELIFYCA